MDGPQVLRLGERPGRVTDAADEFADLVDARIDAAYRLATVILGNALDAEDAVADAALDAWRSRSKLRELDRFDAWFGRILVNACRDRLRSRRRHPVVPIAAVETGRPSPGGDFADRVDAREAMSHALTVLPPDELIVVALRYWSDFTVDAIAERVGVPAGTVKSRLNRALERLRPALQDGEDRP
jgi:RNA polymerase sigma-70 factor (ECF subfamily)